MKRHSENPLITPADVVPSSPAMKVECVFNAGVTEYKGEVLLLVRVAESVKCSDAQKIVVPLLEQQGGAWVATTRTFDRADPRYDWIKIRGFDAPAYLDGLLLPNSTYATPRYEPYGIERLESGYRLQQRRLSRAARTHHGHGRADGHLQRDVDDEVLTLHDDMRLQPVDAHRAAPGRQPRTSSSTRIAVASSSSARATAAP